MKSQSPKFQNTCRTLHLIDIENLMGGSFDDAPMIERSLQHYRLAANYTKGDQAIIGCDARLLLSVHQAWPGAFRAVGRGPDGADRAILSAVAAEDVARRFQRVVLGSGDGIFAPLVARLGRRGVRVETVSRRIALSGKLAKWAPCYPMPTPTQPARS